MSVDRESKIFFLNYFLFFFFAIYAEYLVILNGLLYNKL